MTTQAGTDKDNQVFTCDRCAKTFPINEMIPEDGMSYCRECFDILVEYEEI